MNHYARRCLLASGHPVCPFLFILFSVFVTMATFHPLIAGSSLFCAILLYGLLTNGRQAAKRVLFSSAACVLFGLINPLLSHRGVTVLFTIGETPFTLEAVIAGVCTGLSFCAALCWFSSFHLLMTSDRMIALSGGILPTFSLLFCMVLRFVPFFSARAKEIIRAHAAAFPKARQSKLSRCTGAFSILTTWALENGIDTADSMRARGYGTTRRTNSDAKRFSGKDAVFLAVCLSFAGAALAALFSGKLSVWFYPAFYVMPADGFALCEILSSALLFALAPISTAWEVIRWRFLLWKK